MLSLRELQRAFAASLRSDLDRGAARYVHGGVFTPEERLGIYRNSARSTLASVLRLTYPAVARIVGDDFFEHAASRFVMESAPASGYLNEYGGEFPEFLAGFPGASELAYLPDVARFEWALAEAANAEDLAATTPAELVSIKSDALRFLPHPSVRLLRLRYPGDQIADAVMSADEGAMHGIDLHQGRVHLVVHRGAAGVEAERLGEADYDVLGALFAGEAWPAIAERDTRRAARLLAEQLVKGRLAGFCMMGYEGRHT